MLRSNFIRTAVLSLGHTLLTCAVLLPSFGRPTTQSQPTPQESVPGRQSGSEQSDAAAKALARRQRFEQEKQRLENGKTSQEPPAADPSQTLFITPARVGMLVGDEQRFSVFDIEGHDLTEKTEWSLSNSYVVDLQEGGTPMITARDHGEVSVRARVGSQEAKAVVKVYDGDKLAAGTVRWQVPAIPGYHAKQFVQAVPIANGPDLYALDESDDGKTSLIRALFSDGRQKWMKKINGTVANLTPH